VVHGKCPHCGQTYEVPDGKRPSRPTMAVGSDRPREWRITVDGEVVHRCSYDE
jgi:hypothetical protein